MPSDNLFNHQLYEFLQFIDIQYLLVFCLYRLIKAFFECLRLCILSISYWFDHQQIFKEINKQKSNSRGQLYNLSYKSAQSYKKPGLDFYKLHYPTKRSSSQIIPSIRSSSVASILASPDNQQQIDQPSFIKPRKQVRRHNSVLEQQNQKERIMKKYRQKILNQALSKERTTFKKALSSQNTPQQIQKLIHKLPIRSVRDIQQFSSKNLTLKQSIQHFKDQKNKINILLQSHKQSQQTKLTYLQVKKKEISQQVNREMHEIYDRYFRKEYEGKYGKQVAYAEFEKNIKTLVGKLATNVFQ